MRFIVFSALCAGFLAQTAAADDFLGSYYVELGPDDFYNSSGARLSDPAALFQQDRANFHRFGKRDGADEDDPFFGDRALRAQIPSLLQRGSNDFILNSIRGRTPPTQEWGEAEFEIYICGRGNQPTSLVINYANGDGRNGC